jgi:hypothetical protein
MKRAAPRQAKRAASKQTKRAAPGQTKGVATKPTQAGRARWWAILNSPFVIALLSGLVLAGGLKYYTDRQAAIQDQIVRRSALAILLSEYQQRISALGAADGELNTVLGPSPGIARRPRLDPRSAEFRSWERLSARVGHREWEIVHGTGSYTPSSPEFARVNLLVIAARIENTAGIPDVQLGGVRMLGLLDVEPDILWVFVRPLLPEMMKFGVTRHMLYVNGSIPLMRGASLSARQERVLGFPDVKPGDLQRVMDHSNAVSARLENELGDAE